MAVWLLTSDLLVSRNSIRVENMQQKFTLKILKNFLNLNKIHTKFKAISLISQNFLKNLKFKKFKNILENFYYFQNGFLLLNIKKHQLEKF